MFAVAMLLSAFSMGPSAGAGELFGWLKGRRLRPARGTYDLVVVTETRGVRTTEGPQQYNMAASHFQTRLGVTTYNWGYFGAQSGTSVVGHRNYYNDYKQWSFRSSP